MTTTWTYCIAFLILWVNWVPFLIFWNCSRLVIVLWASSYYLVFCYHSIYNTIHIAICDTGSSGNVKGILSIWVGGVSFRRNIGYSSFLSCCYVWCRTCIKENLLNKCVNASAFGRLKRHFIKPKVLNDNPLEYPFISPPNKRRKLNGWLLLYVQ